MLWQGMVRRSMLFCLLLVIVFYFIYEVIPCPITLHRVISCCLKLQYVVLIPKPVVFFCTFLHVGASCPFLLHPIGLCVLTLQYIFRCQIVSCCIFIYIYIFISLSLSLSLPCLQCPCRPCTDAILGSFPNACSALSSANAWACTASSHNHVLLFVHKTLKPAL